MQDMGPLKCVLCFAKHCGAQAFLFTFDSSYKMSAPALCFPSLRVRMCTFSKWLFKLYQVKKYDYRETNFDPQEKHSVSF